MLSRIVYAASFYRLLVSTRIEQSRFHSDLRNDTSLRHRYNYTIILESEVNKNTLDSFQVEVQLPNEEQI